MIEIKIQLNLITKLSMKLITKGTLLNSLLMVWIRQIKQFTNSTGVNGTAAENVIQMK
jgi:hypothetical protein